MGGASLPPGFRFHPTDEELVGYYLKRKSEGKEIELEVIPVIDLCKFDPWELPEKSFLPRRDMEWFFFCPRDRKYPNGSRTNRATKAGFWKATGKDRKIICKSSMTGYRKTLVFYRGRAPLGDRTDWVMYEYHLCDDLSQGFQGAFALCKVIKKNENGLKTSDVCGEPKRKQIGSSSSSMEVIISDDTPIQRSYVCNESNFSSPIATPYCPLMEECEPVSMEINPSSLSISPPLILDSSKEHPQGHGVYGHFPQDEFPKSRIPWQPHDHELSSSSSYSNFAEEIELTDDDLSRFGCISPYSGHMNYMGFCGNEGIPYEGFETWDQTPIYRQSSGDGSFGELDGLWSQEDNLVIVI